jgi:uncharacterized protein YkwD
MHAKWNFFLIVILLTCFTGLIDASQPLYKSIAIGLDGHVLGASEKPSQVNSIQIVERKNVPTPIPSPYGKSRKIDDVTWTIDVPKDDRHATPQEILIALNIYRQKKGQAPLSWDNKLASYAQERANGFAASNALDGHAGFLDFVNNQDGFYKVGFAKLGENSAIGFIVNGTKLIETVYAGDQPHDDNQLASKWTHVGVGVSSTASNLIFGGGRL